jgi:hypothetical protein
VLFAADRTVVRLDVLRLERRLGDYPVVILPK